MQRFNEVFCVGGKHDAIATQGADLIKRDVKTIGSLLLWQDQAEQKFLYSPTRPAVRTSSGQSLKNASRLLRPVMCWWCGSLTASAGRYVT